MTDADRLEIMAADLDAENARLRAEVERMRIAVQAHHDQRGDNRCHLDDLKLYHDVLGEAVDPYVGALPPDEDMEESCRRYIRQRRCPGSEGVVPLPGDMTIQQLTDEVSRLTAERVCLRSALGSIHAIATDQCRANIWETVPLAAQVAFEVIRDKSLAAIDATTTQVTDDDGEVD